MIPFKIQPSYLRQLISKPDCVLNMTLANHPCRVKVIASHYRQRLENFYAEQLPRGIESVIEKSGISFNFKHFGIEVQFFNPAELSLHDQEMIFTDGIDELIKQFGVVVIKNAYLHTSLRGMGHRNRFPHLKFHYDRTSAQPTPYSLYSRNPFDQEQRKPRKSSTLFIPNIVAYLQCIKEGQHSKTEGAGVRSNYDLFYNEDMGDIINNIAIEHRWDELEGTGEISTIDNRLVLHASYERAFGLAGYRIGVNYCGNAKEWSPPPI